MGAGVLAAVLIGAGWWLGGSHRPAAAAPAVAGPETTAAAAPAPPLPTIEVKAGDELQAGEGPEAGGRSGEHSLGAP